MNFCENISNILVPSHQKKSLIKCNAINIYCHGFSERLQYVELSEDINFEACIVKIMNILLI
ncbi:hypothetical protein RhiirA4_492033 [Rhizophagus irregularis]|uniref:Uncharacterized protein n=1 Tax=Rhizophagus irregularis TaxID=588596 RepID=A0A2I1HWW3_9GLOM|nr:hypothetical protein RhiirA4_492033 [Rhizophagus irregularis]